MRCTFDDRLKNIAGASLLSCFIAGAITALTSPISADNAEGVTISVNRTFKGNRLTIATIDQSTQHDSTEKPTSNHTPFGCEPAFGPFADSARADIYSHTARLDTKSTFRCGGGIIADIQRTPIDVCFSRSNGHSAGVPQHPLPT